MTPCRFPTSGRQQRGNVFAMLFAAVALTGVLAAVGMQTLTGPVSTITRVTQRNIADNNLLMDAKIIVNAAVTGVAGGDADGDGIIEPAEFVPAAVGETPPANGGFLPTNLGLSLTDPWGSKYGYCVWDHGTTNTSTNRLTGDNTASASTQAVIALIAAGPDKTFQTTCSAYSGGPVQVTKASGSDDLIFKYSYAEAAASSNGLWTINVSDDAKAELKDSAGSAVNVTIDRDTGIGDFLGLTTSVISAKTDETIALDGGLLLDADGASADTCTAAEKGSLRLNTDRDDLELCDGAGGWVEVRTPPGGSAGHVQFNDGADGFAGDANLFWDNSAKRLGVGGSPSTHTLDVTGTFGTSGNAAIGGTLGVTGATTLSSTLGVTDNATFDTDTLFVDAANNKVGIGTTSPNGKLSVLSPADGMGIQLNGGWLYLQPSRGSPNQGVQLDTNDLPNGSNAFFISTPSGWTGNIIKSNLDGVEQFSIRHDGSAWFANPVGIGTASPGYLLDVAGTLHAAGAATLGDTLTVTGNATFDTSTLFVDASDDRVGVGTTDPLTKLDVAGGVKIGGDSICNISKAGMVAWNTGVLQLCGADGNWTSLAAIEKLDDIGDVDVPTPNNDDVLAWDGTNWVAKNIALLGPANVNPAGNDGDIQFRNGSDLGADALLHWDDTSKRLGIGTATPEDPLHVALSALRVSGTYPLLRLRNTAASSGSQSWQIQNNGGLYFGTTEDDFSAWQTTAVLYLGRSGNVGVGTASPQSLLHVAGGIQLGDDTATCPGSSNEKLGTLRFNGGNLQVCKSTGWSGVSSGSGGGSSGTQVAFSVHKNGANQTVTASTNTKLTWSTEAFDTNNNFASDRFTPTVAGKYFVTGVVKCLTTAECHAAIYKNGSIVADNRSNTPSGNHQTAVISGIYDMNGSTDYLELYTFTTGTVIGGSSTDTYFAGNLLAGGSDTLGGLSCASGEIPKWNGSTWACAADGGGGSASGAVAFHAHKNGTNQTVTANSVQGLTWSTESFDTNNNFDTGTGRFTPTVAGRYLATVNVVCNDASSYCQAIIRKNGTIIASNYGRTTTTNAAGIVTTVVDMNGSTDYLDAAVYNASGTTIGGGASQTYFTSSQLGGGGGGASEVSFTATLAANTAINNAVWSDIGGYTENHESGGNNFNPTTGKFTAPSAGTYVFSGTAQIGATPGGGVIIQIDGTNAGTQQVCYNLVGDDTGNGFSASCTGAVYLTAGQTVEMIAYQNSGAANNLSARTQFSGFKVGGSDTLAGLSCASGEIPKWNGSAWACATDGGGSGSGSTMVPGWPDAILCDVTAPTNNGVRVLYLSYAPHQASSTTLYRSIENSGERQYLQIAFNAAQNFSSFVYNTGSGSQNVTSDCNSKSIATLYSEGKAFNFVGGGGGSATPVTGRAWRSVSYSPAAVTTYYDLPLDGGNADLSGVTHSTSTNPERMTVSTAGKYLISYGVSTIYTPGGSTNYARVAINGTPVPASDSWNSESNGSYSASLSRSVVVTLSAGDYVTLQVMKNAGTNTFSNGVLSIASIGGGSDILSGLSCASGEIPKWNGSAWACATDGGGSGSGAGQVARASGNSTSVGSEVWTKLDLSNIDIDVGSIVDATNDRITPIEPGYYFVSVTTQPLSALPDQVRIGAGIYVNGSGVLESLTKTASANTDDQMATATSVVYLDGDDYIEARGYHKYSGSQNMRVNNISVARVASGGGSDTLAGLSCASGEIPKWNGSAWACAADGGGGGSGNTVAFRAHKGGTAQSIPSSTSTKLTFSTETFDTNNNFDTSTSRFTPTVAGVYQVTGSVRCDASTTYCQAVIMKNGTGVANHYDYHTTANMAHVTTLVQMNGSTDYLELNGVSGGAAGNINGSDANTYFEAALLGGGSDTLAGLSCASGEIPKWNGTAWACAADGGGSGGGGAIGFYATGSGTPATVNSATTFVYDVEVTDTANAFNPATGVFTAPQAGTYQFIWGAIGYTTNDVYHYYLYKNGANSGVRDLRIDTSLTGSEYGDGSQAAVLTLAQGDTVSVFFQSNGGAVSHQNYSYFSGSMIGGGGGGSSVTPVAASAAITAQSTSSTTITDLPGASVTFTSNGLPTLVMANFTAYSNTASATATFQLVIDGTVESTYTTQYPGANAVIPTQLQALKTLSPGSHTAKVRWLTNTGTLTANWNSGSTSIIVHEIGGGGSDTLAGLSCSSGEIPKWNGSAWACAADGGGSGTQVAFRAYKSGSNQTVTASTWTKLTFNSETYDTNNDFASDRFTATVAGYYSFYAKAYCSDSATQCVVGFSKNGTIVAQHNSLSSTPQASQVSDVIYMGVGDYIEALVWNGGGTTINGTSNLYTVFAGYLIGGGGSDTLSGLSCASGEIPKWNGTAWACAADGSGGTAAFVDGLNVQSNSMSITSACPTYVDVPNSSKSVTLPGGTAAVSWSSGFYGGAGAVGVTFRFCIDSTCGGAQNFYSNEPSSHKLAAGNWTTPISAGTYTAKLQVCRNAGSTAVTMDGNDGTSWKITIPGSGGGGSAGGGDGVNAPPTFAFTGGNIQQTTLNNGITLYNGDARAVWSGVSYTNLPDYLVGTLGTDAVNGSTNLTLTISGGNALCYLIRHPAWAAGPSTTSWAVKETGMDYMPGGGMTVYQRVLPPGSYSLNNLSAMYACDTKPVGGGGSGEPGGADTQVQFNDGGVLGGAAQLFWDKANNRLGIGTASPEQKLHVANAGVIVGDFQSTDNNAVQLRLRTESTNRRVVAMDGSGNQESQIIFNDNGAFEFVGPTIGDQRLTILSSGNVGIGTNAPSTPLEVVGTVKAASGLVWSANGSTATSRSLLLENFDDTANANGVDIGVKLGGTEFQGLSWVQESAWTSSSAAADKDAMLQLGVLNDNTPANSIYVRASGNVGIGVVSPAAKLDVGGGVKIGDHATCTGGTHNGTLRFNSGNLELCTSSGWVTLSGGNGSNTMVSGWPDAIRCVSGAVEQIFYYGGDYNATNKYYENTRSSTGDALWMIYTAATGAYSSNLNGAGWDCVTNAWSIAQLYSNGRAFNFVGGATASADGSAGQVQFNEGGNLKADSALHWDNVNKRLGIGTASPSTKLQVAIAPGNGTEGAGLALGTNDWGGGAGTSIQFRQDMDQGNSAVAAIAAITQTGNSSGQLQFRTSDSFSSADLDSTKTRLTILANGNVGIGAASPTHKLDITGASVRIYDPTTNAPHLSLQNSTRTWNIYNNAALGNAFDVYDATGGTAQHRLVIDGNGNVGIGTTTPSAKLDVRGGVSLESTLAKAYFNNYDGDATTSFNISGATGSTSRLFSIHATSSGTQGTAVSGQIFAVYGHNGTSFVPSLIALNSGSVGIGTASPTSLLTLSAGANNGLRLNNGTVNGVIFNTNDTSMTVGTVSNHPLSLYTNNTPRLTVLANGSIGVGSDPGSYKMYVAGALRATEFHDGDIAATGTTNYLCYSGVGLFGTCSSSIVYKENVRDLQLGLDLVMRLRPRTFDWKADKRHDLGFIAEEVEKIEPLLVRYEDKDDRTEATGVKYEQMPALLVKAIQELKADNDNLRAALEAANDNYEELRREIEALKAAR